MFNQERVNTLEAKLAERNEAIEHLMRLIRRAFFALGPEESRNIGPYDCYDSADLRLAGYLDSLDRAAKEKAEREKIEQIVLNLKARNWKFEEKV